jgi:hypothetical protein
MTVIFSRPSGYSIERDKSQGAMLLNDAAVLVTGGERLNTYRPYVWNTAEIYH